MSPYIAIENDATFANKNSIQSYAEELAIELGYKKILKK